MRSDFEGLALGSSLDPLEAGIAAAAGVSEWTVEQARERAKERERDLAAATKKRQAEIAALSSPPPAQSQLPEGFRSGVTVEDDLEEKDPFLRDLEKAAGPPRKR